MVLDGTFYASAFASLMMNGVCCARQMQEEEERRAVRRDIQVEYERQMFENIEIWEQVKRGYFNSENSYSGHENQREQHHHGQMTTRQLSFSSDAEERRRKLVAEKKQLLVAATETGENSQHGDHPPQESAFKQQQDRPTTTRQETAEFQTSFSKSQQKKHQHDRYHHQLRMPFPPKPTLRARTYRQTAAPSADSKHINHDPSSIPLDAHGRVRSLPTAPVSLHTANDAIIHEPSIEVMTEKSATKHCKTLSLNDTTMLCLMDDDTDKINDEDEDSDTREKGEYGSLEDIPLQ